MRKKPTRWCDHCNKPLQRIQFGATAASAQHVFVRVDGRELHIHCAVAVKRAERETRQHTP